MPGIKLTDEYFKSVALELKCDLSTVKAVAFTETKNAGFDSKGRPIILFERHIFYKYVKKILGVKIANQWHQLHPDICNPVAGGYGAAGENQWKKFSRAFALHKEAAMMSCSWGSFQEMGFNYADLGFDSVGQFVDAIKLGLEAHLVIFIASVRAKGLVDEMRRKDFATFARIYNGPAYKKNSYDTKMIEAEKDFRALNAKNITPVKLATIADLKKQTMRLSEMVEIEEAEDIQQIETPAEIPATEIETEQTAQNNPAPEIPQPEYVAPTNVTPVPQAIPAKDDPPKDFLDDPKAAVGKVKAWYLAAPTAVFSAIAGFWERLTSGETTLVYWLLGIPALIITVYIIMNLWLKNQREKRESADKAEETKLKIQREQQAHELTLLQARSAMEKDFQTIQIIPQPIQNSDSAANS